MIQTLTNIYGTGLILYALLQLVVGNASGTATVTVKWLNNRVFHVRSIYGVIVMSLLWFIVLPVQIYQHAATVRSYKRQRAQRRAEEEFLYVHHSNREV